MKKISLVTTFKYSDMHIIFSEIKNICTGILRVYYWPYFIECKLNDQKVLRFNLELS